MKILLIKTTSLGDVVHNLPVITDIRQHFPDAQIDWVVEKSFAEIPAMHASVNRIIPVAMRHWKKALFSRETWCELRAFKQQLQAQNYDVVIDTQGLLKSGLITYFSHSARKCGYDKTSAREPVASCFYHGHFAVARSLHAVQRNRLLAALALGYSINGTVPNYGIHAPTDTPAMALPEKFMVAFHGTSRDSKLWHTENWVTLGKQLQHQNIALVLPWGNHAEKQRAEHIASQLEQACVLPKLGITALAGVLQQAQAVTGVDTGLAHLAVALNVPTIAIYTDTNPSLTGLYGGAQQTFVNLGGQHQSPSPQEVLAQLARLKDSRLKDSR